MCGDAPSGLARPLWLLIMMPAQAGLTWLLGLQPPVCVIACRCTARQRVTVQSGTWVRRTVKRGRSCCLKGFVCSPATSQVRCMTE